MRLLSLIFFGNFFASAVMALPGFPARLKVAHPELKEVSCLTCHEAKPPSTRNVLPQGERYYREMLELERKKAVPSGRPVILGQNPDFIVYGDSRDNPRVHAQLVAQFCRENPKAVFHTGDIVGDGGSNAQWAQAASQADCLIRAKILYPACGNHEGSRCTQNVLREKLGNDAHYYSISLKEFVFLALDSATRSREQAHWLASLPKGPNYVPFFHHPPYPTISGHKADEGVLREFLPQFHRLGVKLVFTGHNHGYDRALVDGVQYVTEGGGGAPLYPCGPEKDYTQACLSDFGYVRCATVGTVISCEARRLNGDIVDSFSVDYGR